MLAIVSLLMVISLSILITRIASIALAHTGLGGEAARFQARSAFTGVGFTTSESEKLVNHPTRRRILFLLMLMGNAGIVTAVTSLILTFAGGESGINLILKIGLIIAGLVALWSLASSSWVDQKINRIVNKMLKKYTRLDVQDYSDLLHIGGDYRVAELAIEEEDWVANQKLKNIALRDEGILVLGITRLDGTYVGIPTGETIIKPNDTLIVYADASSLNDIDERRVGWKGDRQHRKAVRQQELTTKEEHEVDPVTDTKE